MLHLIICSDYADEHYCLCRYCIDLIKSYSADEVKELTSDLNKYS
jgi:hypothetical protein